MITPELARRPAPDDNSDDEALAFQTLARQMVEHPEGLLPDLVHSAMHLCGAQSAGIAIYEPRPRTSGVCRWRYVAGRYAPLNGMVMPRNDSPPGLCLDRNAPVLLSYPERVFPSVLNTGLPHCEMLLAPLHVSGVVAIGTLCVIFHDEGGHFSAGDARRLSDLSGFAGHALRMINDAATPHVNDARAPPAPEERVPPQQTSEPPTIDTSRPTDAWQARDEHSWQEIETPRPTSAPAMAEAMRSADVRPPAASPLPFKSTLPAQSPLLAQRGSTVERARAAIDEHLREAVEERELLVDELNHRVKNLFTIASSLVAITAREVGSSRDMATTLTGRFRALSRAHELVRPPREGEEATVATLGELVETVIEPFRERDKTDGRIRIEGPEVPIAGDAVTGFALVLYELATNAAKYGALSPPIGQLLVRWQTGGDHLMLEWVESGVLNLTGPPTEEGFGSRLVRLAVERQLNGRIDHDWSEAGLIVRLTMPLAALRETNGNGEGT